MERWKRYLPKVGTAAAALLLFLVASAAYFAPQLRGDELPQHDVVQYEGMASDITRMRLSTGEDPQWTGGMFGGMPAYLINVAYPAQLVKRTVGQVVKVLDTPASFLFFAMTAMWLMLMMFGCDMRAAAVGALAYGFSTYFILIIGAGHVTKMWALVYAPLMMGGARMTLRGSVWCGAAVTALAASLEIGANHPQITYYFLLAMAAMWLADGIASLREKRLKNFALRTAALAAAGIVALASNFAPLYYTAQHSKETIRGGSELQAEAAGQTRSGLDLDYATAWSYGIAESWNLIVPDFAGRDSATSFSNDGAVARTLDGYGWRGAAQQLPAYWGGQPYTGGPTYLGAAALFLAALGIALLRGREKWWIVGISVAMLLLAWGRNWMGLTEFLFKYLPGYNKFRTVSMSLVVVQWAVPLAAALGITWLWRAEMPRRRMLHALAWAAGVTGGLCLLLAVAGSALFDFGRDESAAMMTGQFHHIFASNGMQSYLDRGLDVEMGEAAADAMAAERAAMMRADAWRSLAMVVLAAGAVGLYLMRRAGKYALAAMLAGVVLLDLVPVDLRFLSHDDFVTARRQRIAPTAADLAIMEDKEPGFRVLNLTVSPFNDATTSYFHRSVGGYHGAKLARYQDLIDRYLAEGNGAVLDMLNTRYLIVPGSDGAPVPQLRPTAFGPAWFVEDVATAATPAREIELLGATDLRRTAVVAERDAEQARARPGDAGAATAPAPDTAPDVPASAGSSGVGQPAAGSISLAEYRPNYLRYEYTAPEPSVAVFSEIYYDKGWKAFVDGVEAPYFRADYVLRAMRLPAGTHTVEWRFRAPAWRTTEGITLAASILVLAGAAAAAWGCLRRKRRGCRL